MPWRYGINNYSIFRLWADIFHNSRPGVNPDIN
nr:MAG TPA: hypothetical protein [Caudoviricetes sp.]